MESAKGTVLVAEDEPAVRELTVSALEDLGFHVLAVGDGQEAVEVFQERREDIGAVLLDISMPRLNGLEAFREITKISPDVPVFLTSGYFGKDAVSDLHSEGLAGFFPKPYRFSALVEQLERVVAHCRQRT